MPNFWSDPFGFIFQGFNNLLLGWGWAPATIQVVGYALGALVLVMGSLLFCLLLSLLLFLRAAAAARHAVRAARSRPT